jgi:hypothetical protein
MRERNLSVSVTAMRPYEDHWREIPLDHDETYGGNLVCSVSVVDHVPNSM